MVKICCDSTADLLNEVHGTNLYSQRGVTVMPLYVQIGDEERCCFYHNQLSLFIKLQQCMHCCRRQR